MPTQRTVEYLLDGQQRLTALWRSLNDLYDDYTFFARIHQTDENAVDPVWVDGTARWERNKARYPLWVDRPAEVFRRGLIPLSLLNPGERSTEISAWRKAATEDPDDRERLHDLIGDMRACVARYNIPLLSLPSHTKKGIALDVYIKLNTNSVPLSAFDIVVAELEDATGQSMHDLVSALSARAPCLKAYEDPSDLVLSTAALSQGKAPTHSNYHALDLSQLAEEWDVLASGIADAVRFLETEHVLDADRVPTGAVLPVLAALGPLIPTTGDASGNARALLRKYVWRSFFTRRYENSAPTRSLQDYKGLAAALRGHGTDPIPLFDEQLFPLPTTQELVRAPWPKRKTILGRAILAVSLKKGALDIADGQPATREHLREREYHHLFPEALLRDAGVLDQGDYHRALNCALITWKTNRTLQAKEPLEYLRERVALSTLGEREIRARLASHVVPFDIFSAGRYHGLSQSDRADRVRVDYEAFLNARADLVLAAAQALCAGHSWPLS